MDHFYGKLTVARVTKFLKPEFTDANQVYAEQLVVFKLSTHFEYGIMSSSILEEWAWKNCSTMGGSTLRYSPSDGFQTFPFPQKHGEHKTTLEQIGEVYHSFRQRIMKANQEGLTSTYNRFHNPSETNADIIRLRALHVQMDEVVLHAYGWEDLIEQKYPPAEGKYIGTTLHDFYEVDYLPENDRIRYTLHPEARREILKRLLLLNHELYEEEIKQGLHKEKDVKAFYAQKGQEIPEEMLAFYAKGKGKKKAAAKKQKPSVVSEPKAKYGLFSEDESVPVQKKEVSLHARVTVENSTEGQTLKYFIVKDTKNGQMNFEYQPIYITSQLALAMLNRKPGSKFTCDGSEYEIKDVC